jgi:hypothetical protein
MEMTMAQDSCAACDCPLDEDRRTVTIGGRPVEVCCEQCAVALNEAGTAVRGGVASFLDG